MVITYALMPVVALVSLSLGVFLLKSFDLALFGIILLMFGIWFVFLAMFGALMCSSIVATDDGIAAHNFWRILKYIRWCQITKVTKVHRWNAGSRSFEDVFRVYDGTASALHERMVNLCGPIVFTGKIRGSRGLLDRINQAAHQYHFPLVLLDQEAARELAAQTGAGAWRRTVPRVEEVSLREL